MSDADTQSNNDPSEVAPTAAEEQAISGLTKAYEQMRQEISKVIVGQDEVVNQLLIAMFCRGHCLLVGVPGLAKTLLCSTIAGIATSWPAQLASVQRVGSAGELLQGSYQFQFMG